MGQVMLDQVVKAVSDLAMVEQRSMMEGRRMVMVIGPRGGVIRSPGAPAAPPVGAPPRSGGPVGAPPAGGASPAAARPAAPAAPPAAKAPAPAAPAAKPAASTQGASAKPGDKVAAKS
jgi:hypothetical protein